MNRQNYQQYGLILALIVAGVSLPTAVISLTREPTIINHNYYNTYYNQTNNNYYNQTYYGDNETNTEPDYSKPLEIVEYTNVFKPFNTTHSFNISSGHLYHYVFLDTSDYPPTYLSDYNEFYFWMVSDSMLPFFLESGIGYYISNTLANYITNWIEKNMKRYGKMCILSK